GPGAGRPSKLYRRTKAEVAVSLPERRYDLAGSILAVAIETAEGGAAPLGEAVARAAADAGRSAGAGSAASGDDVERLTEALTELGYEPRSEGADVILANCPFDALVHGHTELVCGLNRSFVSGVIDGLHCEGLEARLEPEPGLCCVKAGRPASGT
ncbi:MAG: transcriptional regulator, partial [Nocardioidaceae bacterium]